MAKAMDVQIHWPVTIVLRYHHRERSVEEQTQWAKSGKFWSAEGHVWVCHIIIKIFKWL